MNIILNKIKSCLKKYSHDDLNDLNNRLTVEAIDYTFKGFLKIENKDFTYMFDNLKTQHISEIEHKMYEINDLRLKLDTIKSDFDNYKISIENTINEKTIELSDFNNMHLQNQIIDLKKMHSYQTDTISDSLNKQHKSQIDSINNNFQSQIEYYKNQLRLSQDNLISLEDLKKLEEQLILTIKDKPNINNESSNMKGKFGEDIIQKIQHDYKLSQNFYLEDTTHLESNGDFVAHNIYPNIDDKILIESKFVKNIKCSTNTKHGKSDLVRFNEHTEKFFNEHLYSHSIIFSMNSDTIPGKGNYYIENINNHYIFYVSINYSKINNDETFQQIINLIFHTIVIHIVENSQQNKAVTNNDIINNYIKILQNTYHTENKTINILENKVRSYEKDIRDFNDLISLHKSNIEQIAIEFNKTHIDLEMNNSSKKPTQHGHNTKKNKCIDIDIIHKYLVDNNHSINFLEKSSKHDLKNLFSELPSQFTKTQIIKDYRELLLNKID